MASSAPLDATIIREVPTAETARKLPRGCIVGDRHGGVTFTDAVSTILQARSRRGWKEVELSGELWTVIVLDR